MPIYEYLCDQCDEKFEKLVLGAEEVVCPKCSTAHISKQFSRFGTGGNGYDPLPIYKQGGGGGGCCSPGSCGCKH